MPSLTASELSVLDAAARELAETVAPYAGSMDEKEALDPRLRKTLRDRGAWELMIPGIEDPPSLSAQSLVIDRVARVCTSSALLLQSQATSVHTLQLSGSEAARQTMEAVARGEQLCGWGVTEPEAGSDILSMTTRAKREADGYRITGEKRFITNAGLVDEYVIFARTSPERSRRSLTAFLVPGDAPGLSVPRLERKMGLRGSPTGDLIMQDVRVPESAVLGELGGGVELALETLTWSRPLIGAVALGVATGALENAVAYARDRKQFGRPIIEFQAVGHLLARMLERVLSARHLLFGIASSVDAAERPPHPWEAATIKTVCSDAAMQVTTDAVQVLGGYGYVREYPVERMMRDAKVLQIFEGTNQIQRNGIMRELRDLPALDALWRLH